STLRAGAAGVPPSSFPFLLLQRAGVTDTPTHNRKRHSAHNGVMCKKAAAVESIAAAFST
ncbi:hypothetical protein, partial [Escherichia coli]|uniref:hypothetical protein n=1 Tax=Escherichia coli TaxID=562 RepID=UPI001BC84EBB